MSENLYLLIRKGKVQRYTATRDDKPVRVWPIATSHADAKRLIKWISEPGTRPAQIGCVEGETLEGHFQLARDDGCVAACWVLGWNPDGSPRWGWKMLD